MAKRTTRPPEEPPPPPSLRMPRQEANEKITARIEKGDGVRQRLGAPSGPGPSVGEDYKAWDSYNKDLLLRMFTDRTIAQEYEYCGPPPIVRSLSSSRHDDSSWLGGPRTTRADPAISDKLDAKVAKLRSIRERLELYEWVGDPALTEAEEAKGIIDRFNSSQSRPASQQGPPMPDAQQPPSGPPGVFIVHGHDEAAKVSVARLVELLGFTAIILHEQVNEGKTIIEKFEKHAARGDFAVVLLTADDFGGPLEAPEKQHPRARQNVLLELGYFVGKLGRPRVCALHKGEIELPSDYLGVLYTPMDPGGAWRFQIAREMKAAGLPVDMNRL